MQSFMEAIVRMGIFMICAQVLIHFRPNGSYEKYMKLLVSVMVLAQIFFPLANLFLGAGQEMEERVVWFEEQMQKSRREALENAGEAERLLNSMTMEELRRQMEAGQKTAGGQQDAGQKIATGQSAGGESISDVTGTGEDIGDMEGTTIDKIKVEIGE